MRPVALVWAAAMGLGLAYGCGSEEDPGSEPGGIVCQMTPEECVALFEGTYSGTYSGSQSGTWTVFISTDGTVEGTVTSPSGTDIAVTGWVDKTGVVKFDAADVGTFQGVIDFDQNVSGDWSGAQRSGTFTGAFVSREPPSTGTGGAGPVAGGTGGSAPGSTGGATTTYCDRSDAKAAECGIAVTSECIEPTTDEDRCLFECTFTLTCAELEDPESLIDCLSACPVGGERDYCAEYENKLETCGKQDTLLILDICGTPVTTETACTWGCVLDATCEAFMDEQALLDSCTAGCQGS